MRVLILGGTGLISTPLVEQLIANGHEPVVFNRGVTPSRLSKKVAALRGNRSDFNEFEAMMAEEEFDAVADFLTFDSATAAHSVKVFSNKIEHYLFVSAAAVYGPLETLPADENTPHRPTGQYGEHKSEAETVFAEAAVHSRFPVTIVRPSLVYGPGQPVPSVFGYDSCLVERIRQGHPVPVPGDGYGLLQPLFSADAGAILAAVLEHRDVTVGGTYNFAGPRTVDWRTLFTALGTALDATPRLMPLTTGQIIAGSPPDASTLLEEMFQYHMVYDDSRVRGILPENLPYTPLEDGLGQTVAWMDETHAHLSPDEQPWVNALVEAALDFEKDLALSDHAFDHDVFSQE
jgi:nucleoside-diphosphate-sugar epimerase